MQSRSSLIPTAILLLAATHSTGCGSSTTDPTLTELDIRGTIISRTMRESGVGLGFWSRPMILVDGTAFREVEEPCQAQWWLSISSTTEIWQGAVRADTSQLTVGREVEVTAEKDWLLPCPPIGVATRIELR